MLAFSLVVAGGVFKTAHVVTAQTSATPSPSDIKVSEVIVEEESFTIVRFTMEVDSEGLLNRSDEASADVADALSQVLSPLTGCQIVLGLIFGGGVGQVAIDTASLIAEVLYLEFADMSHDATFGRLSLNDAATVDQAKVTLYFKEDCEELSEIATPSAYIDFRADAGDHGASQ